MAPLQIAIVGGGLGGITLFKALLQHDNLDVHIYESSPNFKERGASVSLSINAQRALNLLGMGSLLEAAGGVRSPGSRVIIGQGPQTGTHVVDLSGGHLVTVHREALLRELVKDFPSDRIHFNKKLKHIEQGNLIIFEDGEQRLVDAIIGADGTNSTVREYVLGKGHEAVNPVPAGFWDTSNIISIEKAMEKLGDKGQWESWLQHLWIGEGTMLVADLIDDGRNVCVGCGGQVGVDWDKTEQTRTVSKDWLEQRLSGYGDLGRDIAELLTDGNTEKSVCLEWESAVAPYFCHETEVIAMIGDAAHTTTPWQDAGVGQSIEDALILNAVLARCNKMLDVRAAFEAYDLVRRIRSQMIIESSRKTGELFTGKEGLEAHDLKDILPKRLQFMWEYDHIAGIAEAVEILERTKRLSYTRRRAESVQKA